MDREVRGGAGTGGDPARRRTDPGGGGWVWPLAIVVGLLVVVVVNVGFVVVAVTGADEVAESYLTEER